MGHGGARQKAQAVFTAADELKLLVSGTCNHTHGKEEWALVRTNDTEQNPCKEETEYPPKFCMVVACAVSWRLASRESRCVFQGCRNRS